MERYPIVIKGKTVGEVSVMHQGSKTLFSADCRMLEGIVRIAVFGGGRRGYLGVLAPKGDRLCLEKSFSSRDMAGFPEKIEYAAPFNEAPRRPSGAKAEGEAKWKRACDGALYCMSGARSLVALPAEDRRVAGRRLARTVIENREYALLSPELYRVLK